jgi:hypothetical protein
MVNRVATINKSFCQVSERRSRVFVVITHKSFCQVNRALEPRLQPDFRPPISREGNERSYLVFYCYFLICEKVAISNVRSHQVSGCYSLFNRSQLA